MMDPQKYEVRNKELLGLLKETLDIGIPEPHNGILREIQRKCQEDQFEIALVGEFQGGKSTTFNALCDGREISPRGLGGGGLKTSAAIVTAQHISDPNEKREGLSEWAEIHWRNDSDIVLGFADLLKNHLADDKEFQELFSKRPEEERIGYASSPELVAKLLELTNVQHRKAINHALDMEWGRWERNKSAYTDDELEQLRITTLQMRFYNTDEQQKLTGINVFSIPEFQKLITFPRDWYQRWESGQNSKFGIKDCSFVYIADVLVRLYASNLSRIGCRITDCPGLFASAWDTGLARKAMWRADGIWFLIDGTRQIGLKEKKVIKFIQDNGWTGKLRTSVNMRGNTHDHIIENIIPEDKAILNSMGLNENQLNPFDARFAFLSCQGKHLLANPSGFGEWDRYCMAFDFDRRMPVEKLEPFKAWRRLVRLQASVTGYPSLEEIEIMDDENIQAVRESSHLDEILGEIESVVIEKKAESILIANGSRPAVAALASYEGLLQAKEDAARIKEEEFKKACEAAQKNLSEFLRDADEVIEPQRDDGVDSQLAFSLWDAVITSSLSNASKSSGDDIGNNVLTLSNLLGLINPCAETSRETLAKEAAEILIKQVRETMLAEMTKWFNDLRHGKNNMYQDRVASKAQRACKRISDKWERHVADITILAEKSLMSGITLPEIQGILSQDEARLRKTLKHGLSDEVMNLGGVDITNFNINGIITAIIGVIVTIIVVALTPLGWVTLILGVIAALLAGGGIAGLQQSQINQRITRQLEQALNSHLVKKQGEIIAQLAEKVRPFRLCYLNYLENAMKSVKLEFDNRVKQAEEMFRESNANRLKIAEESYRLRKEKITPARERIARFEAEVQKELIVEMGQTEPGTVDPYADRNEPEAPADEVRADANANRRKAAAKE